jgi:plasmid rolling circle replication initiator protein Rep
MNNTIDLTHLIDKFTKKKLRNEFLADCHDLNNNYKKAVKSRKCGTYIELREYEDCHCELNTANFCKGRLCPMCNWRLSKKRLLNLSAVTKVAKADGYELLFLTLTAKNVSGDLLKSEIKNYFAAWKFLSTKNPIFKKSIHGWFRALEVTYNEKDNSYHPHLHIILVVKSTYFKTSGYYISQSKWVELWQHALKLNYDPIVHIQKTYSKKGGSPEQEASKYTVKDSDYLLETNLKLSAHVVEILDSALFRVRIIAYGGICKEIYKSLSLNEKHLFDTESLDDINSELAYVIKSYSWHFGTKSYGLVRGY